MGPWQMMPDKRATSWKEYGMRDYLVDVAVKTNLWIRTDLQREQFEVIKKARPSILFLISDGGRNEAEWEAIRKNRKMYDEEIDWNCTVYRQYEDQNQGMYAMGKKEQELVWSHVDSCIFMEDDIIPAVSFFRFCAEMLERYKDDLRVFAICGTNYTGVNEACSSDYFFSRYGAVWGVATWKRSFMQYHTSFMNDSYTMNLLRKQTKAKGHNCHWKQIVGIAKKGMYDGHVPGDEFYMSMAVYGYYQLLIIPKYNLTSNKGCSASAAHGDSLRRLPRGIRPVFNSKTYELDFPLKEPKYMIPDVDYEKKRNRILALDHPIVRLYRKVERSLYLAASGDFSTLFEKVMKYIDRSRMAEK